MTLENLVVVGGLQEQKPDENPTLSLPKPIRRRECLREMIETMQSLGPWSINKTFFAKKYGFCRETIIKWDKNLSKGIDFMGAIPIRNRTIDSLINNIRICEQKINDPDTEDFIRLKYMERQESLYKTLNLYLEAYGLKEKVAEKQEILTASLDLNRVLEIATAKAERLRKAQEAAR